MLFTFFTLSGPVVVLAGIVLGWQFLFWIGVTLCAINLILNLASGVMRFPILPLLFIVPAALIFSPWHVGAAVGLAAYTAIEGAGEVLTSFRRRR